MKVLCNVSVTKLREYKQSYGNSETIIIPFVEDYAGYILLKNECGEIIRQMKKGTKLLINYSGKEITERQFYLRIKKAKEKRETERKARIAAMEVQEAAARLAADKQAILWRDFLNANPESKAKYITRCNSLPSSKWRNYLKMKAARHINNEKFEGLEISAPTLKYILFN